MRPFHELKAGHCALREDRADDALNHAEAILKQKPGWVKALLLKALALHALDRSDQALQSLSEAEEGAARSHVPFLFQALVWYDLGDWERAARAIGAARLLSHTDDFVTTGLERLIHVKLGEQDVTLAPFAESPGVYNEFVGPRLLYLLEDQIIARRATLPLPRTRWAKLENELPPSQPRSVRTIVPFVCLRVPVLLLQRIFGRSSMPFSAEEAYLRGDIESARRTLAQLTGLSRARKTEVDECSALLSMDLGDLAECLRLLPPRGKEPDPMREFARGYCLFHTEKWRKAERCFADAGSQPISFYFRGLCHVALEHRIAAQHAFTREIRRDDMGIAERITVAGQVLQLFPAAEKVES